MKSTSDKYLAIIYCSYKPSQKASKSQRVISYSGLSRALGIPVSTVRHVCIEFEKSKH